MKRLFLLYVLFSHSTIGAQQPRLTMPLGHMFQVAQANFSANDQFILTRAENVKVWEVSTGKLIKGYESKESPKDAALFNNNKTLAIAYKDSIECWDIETDKLIRTIAGNNVNIYDKLKLAVVMKFDDNDPAATRNAQLYRLPDFKLLHTFKHPIAAVGDDGKLFLTADIGKIEVYDAAFKLQFADSTGTMVGITGDFGTMAIQLEQSISIVNTLTGKILNSLPTDKLSNYSIRFRPDSNRMVVRVKPMKDDNGWLMQNGNSYFFSMDMRSLDTIHLFPEQKGNLEGFEVTEKYIISSSTDSSLRVWELYSGALIAEMKDPLGYSKNIDISEDGRNIIATNNATAATVWNIQKKKKQFSLSANTSYIKQTHFSSNGKLAVFQRDNDAWVWDIEKAEPVLAIPADPGYFTNRVTLSRSGQRLLVAVNEKGITEIGEAGAISFRLDEVRKKRLDIYDVNKRKPENSIPLPNAFRDAFFHPDGKNVLVTQSDSVAFLFNINNPSQRRNLPGLRSRIEDVIFTEDGSSLGFVSDNRFVLLDAVTLAIRKELVTERNISGFAFNPKSSRAVLVLDDQTVVVYDLSTGNRLLVIDDFKNTTTRMAYSDVHRPIADTLGKFFCIKGFQRNEVIVIDGETRSYNFILLDIAFIYR